MCVSITDNLDAIGASSVAIFEALLGKDVADLRTRAPKKQAVETVSHVRAIHEAAGLLGTKELRDPKTSKSVSTVDVSSRPPRRLASRHHPMHSANAMQKLGANRGLSMKRPVVPPQRGGPSRREGSKEREGQHQKVRKSEGK